MGKILLFGGTFDPPHKGHRHLLETAISQVQFDRIFLIPAYIPPHKDHRPALNFEARKGIIEEWFGNIPCLEILDIEEKLGGRSYTINTVEAIQKNYPNDDLYLLIGSDMFLSFEQWRSFEQLLERLVLVVGSRKKGDLAELETYKKHLEQAYNCKGIILCKMEAIECASSTLRASGRGIAEQVLAYIGQEMDVKRARHTVQVADYARTLAVKNGVDPEQAYLAGLLHDCTKCRSRQWQVEYAKEHGIVLTKDDLACPQVLHQITAPIFAEQEFGVTDRELLSALGCHTTGKPAMSPLEMLLLFADSCEPSRTYPAVEKLRAAGEKNLKEGTLMLLDHMIIYLNEKETYLHPQTVAARDYLLKELEKNGRSC